MQSALIPIAPSISLKKIVVTTDFSYASAALLSLISPLARRFKAELIIAHALPKVEMLPEMAAFSPGESEAEAKNKIVELLRRPDLDDLNMHGRIVRGDPATEILNLARVESADLLVIGTHGHRGFRHFLLGSVCEEVIRQAECAVLTIGPHVANKQNELVRILVPTDLSADSLACVDLSNALAHEFAATLDFLHVLPPETATNPEMRDLSRPLLVRMCELISSRISPSGAPVYLVEVGSEASTIVRVAEERKAGLIVMGVRRGSPAMRLHSSVLYQVITDAKCPVLTIRKRK